MGLGLCQSVVSTGLRAVLAHPAAQWRRDGRRPPGRPQDRGSVRPGLDRTTSTLRTRAGHCPAGGRRPPRRPRDRGSLRPGLSQTFSHLGTVPAQWRRSGPRPPRRPQVLGPVRPGLSRSPYRLGTARRAVCQTGSGPLMRQRLTWVNSRTKTSHGSSDLGPCETRFQPVSVPPWYAVAHGGAGVVEDLPGDLGTEAL
jgi:hypothetical protein